MTTRLLEPDLDALLDPEAIGMLGVDAQRDPRSELIAVIYRLHGSLRSLFAGPNAKTGLVLLEALALVVIMDAPDPPTVSEVGRVLGYSRQSVQRAVNKLAELGLVRTVDNPRHKRAPIYIATPEGVERTRLVRMPALSLAGQLATDFSDQDTDRLVRELHRLLDCIVALNPASPRRD